MENEREILTQEEKELRKKRAAKKRRFRLAIVIFAFTLVIGTLVAGVTSLFIFRVKSFVVDGASENYKQEQIIQASGIELNKSLIFIDLEEAEEAVERNLPFLKNVKITKKLPNNLIIRFEESGMAYAVETTDGVYALTNDEFKVLGLSGKIEKGVIPVKGQKPVKTQVGETIAFMAEDEENKDAQDAVLALLKDIAFAVSESKMTGITAINISSLSDIYIIYQDRILVEFGDMQNIEAKTSLFVRAIERENEIDSTRTGIMDITIAQSAYIYPSDIRDIPELVEHLGLKAEAEEEEKGENEDETKNEEKENEANSEE